MSVICTTEVSQSSLWSTEDNLFKRVKKNGDGTEKTTYYAQSDLLGKGSGFLVYLLNPINSESRVKALKISTQQKCEVSQEVSSLGEFKALTLLKGSSKFYAKYLKQFHQSEYYILGCMNETLRLSYEKHTILELVQIINDLSKELMTIHDAGVMHNDVSLGNIMSDKKGEYHFIDFGHSHILDELPIQELRKGAQIVDVFQFSNTIHFLLQEFFKSHPDVIPKDLRHQAENIAIEFDSPILEIMEPKKEIEDLQNRVADFVSKYHGLSV